MERTPCLDSDELAGDAWILAFLRRLMKINTERAAPCEGAPFGEGCAAALASVLNECERRGFETHRVNDMIAWAEVGSTGPLVAFPIHLDVVKAGEGWSYDPYAATIDDGVLYGRGAMDNKVSAAILIELLGEYEPSELPCRLRLIFGTDEESGMQDMRAYLEEGGEQPVMGFVPDAAFPVIRGEKAQMRLGLRCESSNLKGFVLNAGTMVNVVPSAAEAILAEPFASQIDIEKLPEQIVAEQVAEGLKLVASGRSSHGSQPERGDNAAARLLSCLAGAYTKVAGVGELLGLVDKLLCRDINGSALGIYRDDEVFGGSTMNLGIVHIDEQGVTAELDIRYGRGIDAEGILQAVSASFGDSWSCEVLGGKPVHLVDEGDACVQVLLDAYEQVTGKPGTCSVMGGGTYASLLPALVAFGPKFPETHCGAHGVDEHIALDDIKRATEVYRLAIQGIVTLAENERK